MGRVTIPTWLFDELSDRIADDRELVACAEAWASLLAGAEELRPAPLRERESLFDARKYAELQRRGAPKTGRSGFWKRVVEP